MVVIGAGAAGLTAATLLQSAGIDSVVLERRSCEAVEERQRAGVVEYRAVAMFERWGLADELLGNVPPDDVMELRVDGVRHLIDLSDVTAAPEGGPAVQVRLCPQQLLVRRLIARYSTRGDLRFEAADATVSDGAGDRPAVRYTDPEGRPHEITCEYVAVCDGGQGVTRGGLPSSAFTSYVVDHGITWLSVLTDTDPPAHPLMAISPDGMAAQFLRGRRASRFYLQCDPGSTARDWPPDRVWAALRHRLADPGLPAGRIVQAETFDLRTAIHEPMRHGRLFLLGDAAHVIPPMGGKGMNLALHDAGVFADAVVAKVRTGDDAGLDAYSDTCLRLVWGYAEFSHWMSEMVHDAGDARRSGPLRHRLARARLERMIRSPAHRRAFAELMVGLD